MEMFFFLLSTLFHFFRFALHRPPPLDVLEYFRYECIYDLLTTTNTRYDYIKASMERFHEARYYRSACRLLNRDSY